MTFGLLSLAKQTRAWQTLKIGGGGLMVGLHVNQNDGTRLVYADVYGAYIWNAVSQEWEQLVTQARMPTGYFGFVPTSGSTQQCIANTGYGQGAYCVASAPSNSNVIYMAYGGIVYVSTTKPIKFQVGGALVSTTTTASASAGASTIDVASATGLYVGTQLFNSAFTAGTAIAAISGTTVTLTQPLASNIGNGATVGYSLLLVANDGLRGIGPKLAVHPTDPITLYLGGQTTLYVSTDGAASWSPVSGVPNSVPQDAAHNASFCVAFDPATPNTRYAYVSIWTGSAWAGQLWCTTNGGVSWSEVTTSGMPLSARHVVVAPTGGQVWVTDLDNNVFRYSGGLTGSWYQFTALGSNYASIAVNPFNADHVILTVSGGDGDLQFTTNGTAAGASVVWTDCYPATYSASPVGWLGFIGENMFVNDIQFDASVTTAPYKCVAAAGQGVWELIPPTGTGTFNYTNISQGVEEQVAQCGISINTSPVLGFEDNGVFKITPGTYPSKTANPFANAFGLNVCYDLDYVVSNPAKFVGVISNLNGDNNNSGTSIDGGATWKPFNSYYAGGLTASANLSNTTSGDPGGAGNIKVTLTGGATTAGLTTWANGSGSILTMVAYGGANSATLCANYYAHVVDSTHVILIDVRNVSPGTLINGDTAYIYVDANPLTDYHGAGGNAIASTQNDGTGQIQVNLQSWGAGVEIYGTPIVSITGAAHCNGQWIATDTGSESTFSLAGSTYSAADSAGSIATTMPPGGCIACDSSGASIVMMPSQNELPYYSDDFGLTWSKLAVPGTPLTTVMASATWSANTLTVGTNIDHGLVSGDPVTFAGGTFDGQTYTCISGTTGSTIKATVAGSGAVTLGSLQVGWPYAQYNSAHPLTSDKVAADTFYLWNFLTGLYQVSGGVASLLSAKSNVSGVYSVDTKLKAALGKQGHVFLCSGGASGVQPAGSQLLKYVVGTGWTVLTGTAPLAFDIGAAAAGASYPTVAFIGWYENEYGFWISTDGGTTWSLLAGVNYPNGSQDSPECVVVDQINPNYFLIGFSGSSFAEYR